MKKTVTGNDGDRARPHSLSTCKKRKKKKKVDKLSRHRATPRKCPQKANCSRQANVKVYARDEEDRAKPHYVYHPIANVI